MILSIKKLQTCQCVIDLSKIYEKLMQRQMNNFIANDLFSYLCRYKKGYNTQQALVSLIEKWKKILDDKGFGSERF